MFESKLSKIKETLDQVSKAIHSLLGVHITIVDINHKRISGAGRYEISVGQVMPGTSAFEYAKKNFKCKIIDTPREDSICSSCKSLEICEEYA